MQRHFDIRAWQLFVEIARKGSMSAAAEALLWDLANVSRTIASLEESIGQELFHRESPIRLTEFGKSVFHDVEQMLLMHDNIVLSASTDKSGLTGQIRCGLPPAFFDRLLLRHFIAFNKQYPEIRIKTIDYRRNPPVDFLADGEKLDLIICFGPDLSLDNDLQFWLEDCMRVPLASPEYLKTYGQPEKIADLKNHVLLLLDEIHVHTGGYLIKTGEHDVISKFGDRIEFSSPSSLKQAALLGAGIHYGAPSIYCYHEIERGELVVLPNLWVFPPQRYYAFLNPNSRDIRRVRFFCDYIVRAMRKEFSLCKDVLQAKLFPDY